MKDKTTPEEFPISSCSDSDSDRSLDNGSFVVLDETLNEGMVVLNEMSGSSGPSSLADLDVGSGNEEREASIEVEELKKQILELTEKLVAAEKSEKELDEKLAKAYEKIDEVQIENEGLKDEITVMRTTSAEKLRSAVAYNGLLHEQLQVSEKENEALKAEIQRLREDAETRTIRENALEKEIDELTIQMGQEKDAISKFKTRVLNYDEDMRAFKDGMQSAVFSVVGEQRAFTEVMDSIRRLTEESSKRFEQCNQTLLEKEREFAVLTENLLSVQAEKQEMDLKEELVRMNLEDMNLKQELEKFKSALAEEQEEVKAIRKEKQELMERNKMYHSELVEIYADYNKLTSMKCLACGRDPKTGSVPLQEYWESVRLPNSPKPASSKLPKGPSTKRKTSTRKYFELEVDQ